MTSGARTLCADRRGWLGVALAGACALALPGAASATAFDLDALMALLATRRSGEARFTEERFVSGLDHPLRARGTLSFLAPDRFARTTVEPRAESMEVDGNTLVMRRGGRTRQMQLDSVPEVASMVGAMRGTLTGDAAGLRRLFRTEVRGTPATWTLTLVPLERRLALHVLAIEIAGQSADVRSIEVQMPGGDRSVMQVEPLGPVRTATP